MDTKKNKIALIFHININHLSLTYKQRADYIRSILPLFLSSINYPINIAICGEDLLMIKKWNKSTYKELVSNKNIKFFKTFFTHQLPQMFPQYLHKQIMMGGRVLSQEIDSNRIMPIGYSSEVDLPKNLEDYAKYWDGAVIGETRMEIDGIEEKDIPSIIGIKLGNKNFKVFTSRRKINFRNYLHEYLRGKRGEKSFIKGVTNDFNKYADNLVLPVRIDLEVLVFNRGEKEKSIECIHRWKKLATEIKNNFECVFLDDFLVVEDQIIDKKNIRHNPVEDYKWINNTRENEWSNKGLIDQKYFSFLCSDYFCTEFPDIILNSSKNGTIEIVKSRRYRDSEYLLKQKIADKSEQFRLNNIKNKYLRKYIDTFMKMVKIFDNPQDSCCVSSAHVLIVNNKNEVLLTKRQDIGLWVIPGGHVDKGEVSAKAAMREIKEETGLVIKKMNLKLISGNNNILDKHLYACTDYEGQIKTDPKEVSAVGWFPSKELPMPISLYEKNRIQTVCENLLTDKIISQNFQINLKKEIFEQAKTPHILFYILWKYFLLRLRGNNFYLK